MTEEFVTFKAGIINEMLNDVFDGFTDDHDGKTVVPEVVLLRIDGKKMDLCPAYPKSRYFCINPLYNDHDGIHLSVGSIGGVVDMRYVADFDVAIEEYNRFHTDKLFVVRPNNASMRKARERIAAVLA